MRLLLAGGLLVSGLLLPTEPKGFRLDEAGGVGGIRFGDLVKQTIGLTPRFSGVGKRWRTTRLYSRPGDTTRLGGLGVPSAYWFRQNRFIGVDVQLTSAETIQQALHELTRQYGPALPDTLPGHWYWMGQHSYILLERSDKKSGFVFIASLAMLNEQVYETAVRARARRLLGWRPDSLGLPHQFPVH